jgi:hypothetical protein
VTVLQQRIERRQEVEVEVALPVVFVARWHKVASIQAGGGHDTTSGLDLRIGLGSPVLNQIGLSRAP